ncbi:Uncharacterised protein [Klebsiella pneumoniae]|nr:Uncharacterised protein [Klebsiella pneumoniae]
MGRKYDRNCRGVTAAAMIIKDPVQRQMAYEARNAEIANTGYNEIPPDDG